MIALLIASSSGASIIITDTLAECEMIAPYLTLFAKTFCMPAGVWA